MQVLSESGSPTRLGHFSAQEKLFLRLLWNVAILRGEANRDTTLVLDTMLLTWANRIVTQDRKQGTPSSEKQVRVIDTLASASTGTTDMEGEWLCRVYAGICKLYRRSGRSLISLLCLDLMQSALSKHDINSIPGRKPTQEEQVLQRLRILCRTYPGILSAGDGRATDLVDRRGGLPILAATMRMLVTLQLSEEAKKSTGTESMKRDRSRFVQESITDIAEANGWKNEKELSLDELLTRIVDSIKALPQHNSEGTPSRVCSTAFS